MNYSVLICTYNGEKFIVDQILSILSQTILPQRIYISDDGSSDSTIDLCVKTLKENNYLDFSLIEGPQNGASINFLNNIDNFTTDYLFLCDQDDVWLPGKIKAYADYLKYKQCDLIFSDAYIYFDDGIDIGQMKKMSDFVDINLSFFGDDSILLKNIVQGATICLSRRLAKTVRCNLNKVGMENIVIHDWFIAINAKYFGAIGYIQEPQILYRQHKGNIVGYKTTIIRKLRNAYPFIKQLFFLKKIIFYKRVKFSSINFFKKNLAYLLIYIFNRI